LNIGACIEKVNHKPSFSHFPAICLREFTCPDLSPS
jgi:hypothetical protein